MTAAEPGEAGPTRSAAERLEHERARGARARALIEDPLLASAFAAVEEGLLAAWRGSTARDTEGRERLFVALGLLDRVRQALTAAAETGRLADHMLARIARGERSWPWR